MEKIIYNNPSDIFVYADDEEILAAEFSTYEFIKNTLTEEVEFLFSDEEFKSFLENKKKEILQMRCH